MNNNYTIRQAQKSDSRRVWEIRNHPISRKYSGNPDIIPFANHLPWFKKKYFSGLNNHCYILEANQKTIGYCRLDFDEQNDNHIISLAIDPAYQGRGLSHKLLASSLKRFKSVKLILAQIQKENIPSLKLFMKNGFQIYKQDDTNYYLNH